MGIKSIDQVSMQCQVNLHKVNSFTETLKRVLKMIQKMPPNRSHIEALCFMRTSHLQKRRFAADAIDDFQVSSDYHHHVDVTRTF